MFDKFSLSNLKCMNVSVKIYNCEDIHCQVNVLGSVNPIGYGPRSTPLAVLPHNFVSGCADSVIVKCSLRQQFSEAFPIVKYSFGNIEAFSAAARCSF